MSIISVTWYLLLVSRARTSNYIPQYLLDVITCPCLETCLWHTTPQISVGCGAFCKHTYEYAAMSGNSGDQNHYDDVIMGAIASQITNLTIVYSIVYSDADQRKHQSSASPAFMRGIHRGPVNSPHKCPVTRKMFPFDDIIMLRMASA